MLITDPMNSRKWNQRVIIVEGADGTGKTEIARALSTRINVPYFRMNTQHDNWRAGRFKDALEFDQTYISQFLDQTATDVIIDRAYPSEFVYSIVYGRETNERVLRDVDAKFASFGTIVLVLLRRDYSKSRADDLVTSDKLEELHSKYLEFIGWTKCKTVCMYVDEFENNLELELNALVPALELMRWSPQRSFTLVKT